jgi:hypothetical protein
MQARNKYFIFMVIMVKLDTKLKKEGEKANSFCYFIAIDASPHIN